MSEPTKEPALSSLLALWAAIGGVFGGMIAMIMGGALLTNVFVGALAGTAGGYIAHLNRGTKK